MSIGLQQAPWIRVESLYDITAPCCRPQKLLLCVARYWNFSGLPATMFAIGVALDEAERGCVGLKSKTL